MVHKVRYHIPIQYKMLLLQTEGRELKNDAIGIPIVFQLIVFIFYPKTIS